MWLVSRNDLRDLTVKKVLLNLDVYVFAVAVVKKVVVHDGPCPVSPWHTIVHEAKTLAGLCVFARIRVLLKILHLAGCPVIERPYPLLDLVEVSDSSRHSTNCFRVDSPMEKKGFPENVGHFAFAQVLQHEVVSLRVGSD